MIAYGFKAGTGTASRLVAAGGEGLGDWTVAALVQANHGRRPWFHVLGRPVGQAMPDPWPLVARETGSVIVVLATDAPLSALSLRHLARRASLGIGRGGTPGGNSSGDLFLAFSTADPGPVAATDPSAGPLTVLNLEGIDDLYLAAVEAVEEAVVNAIVAGEDVPTVKPPGRICQGIDRDALAELFARAWTDGTAPKTLP